MADVFVNSAAVGGGTGADWANAFTTFAAGIAALANGDRLIWAITSSEIVSANTTFTLPGNNVVISSTVSGTNTITYSPAASAQFSISANNNITINGNNSSMLGCYIEAGTDLNISNGLYTEDCTLVCGNGASPSAATITVLGSGSTWKSVNDTRRNNSIASTQPVIETGVRTYACILGGSVSSARTTNNTGHVAFENVNTSSLMVDGVDCSGFQMSRLSSSIANGCLKLTSIRLNPLTTELYNESSVDVATDVYINAVDNASEVNRQYFYAWRGRVESDTTITLDTTNPSGDSVSLEFDTNANASEFFEPLRYPISYGWIDFTSARTISIEFVQDGSTDILDNAQVWIEVRAPDGTTANYDFFSGRATDNQNGVNHPVSTADWTGLSATNSRQTASVTTDGNGKAGPYEIYFCSSVPSVTLNVNPEPSIS